MNAPVARLNAPAVPTAASPAAQAQALAGIDASRLPTTARRLVSVMGIPATLALLNAFGGTRLELPSRYPQRSQLVEVIGLPAVRLLVASELAGQRLDLPKADKLHWQLARAYCRAMQPHKTKRELSIELGCSSRYVQKAWNTDASEVAAATGRCQATRDLFADNTSLES